MKIRNGFVSNSSSTSFIMILEGDFSKREFINRLGAKEGSFAAHLIGQVYDSLKNNSDDYQQEFQNYHMKEYDSFEEYLEKNKNFQKNTIKRIKDAYKNGKTIYIGKFESAGGNTPIESYLCLEDFKIDENGIFIDALDDSW